MRIAKLTAPATDEKVLIERKVPPVVIPPFGDTWLSVEGLGFVVQGLGFRVQGLGCRV